MKRISFPNLIRATAITSVFFLLAGVTMLAQAGPGSLHGTVTDPSGAAVTKADVQVIGPDGKVVATTTNQTGSYEVKGLAAGQYGIKVSAKGFSLYEVDGIDVAAGQSQKMDVSLSIEVQQQNVNVSDQAIGLDTSAENNVTQMVLSGKDLDALSDDPDELATDLQALAGPSAGPNGGQIYIDGFTGGQLPPKSSIREIRINQNPFSAQFDKLGYGRIEIFTKPGTDQYHGQISTMGNSSYFNSTSPFATETPSYDSTQYTANFGGPMGKKASFFINFERRNIGDNAIVNAFVLDPSYNQVPYNTSVPIPQTRTNVSPRMDFQLTPNNTLSVRYQWWQNNLDNSGVGQFSLPTQAYNQTTTEQTFQLSDTQLFGTKVVNEIRFQYLRDRTNQTPAYTDATINVQGAFVGGGNSSGYNIDNQDHYELQNYTSWLLGQHVLKFGGRLRALRDSSYSNSNFNGTFTFNSLDEYEITEQGLANGLTPAQIRAAGGGAGQFSITYGTPSTVVTYYDVGLYVADDWKLRPNFTLSYGLRYETQTDINDHGDLAPRLSFAWGLGRGNASPKTVLRAGWGMFYDRFDEQYILQADRLNGTTQQQFIVNQPNFYPIVPPQGSPLLNTAKTFPTVYQLSPNLRAAYTMQTAISVERQINRNANIAISYLNSRGVHQFLTRNINAPFPNTYDPNVPTSGIRPFGDVGNIYQYESNGTFKQNQLIVNANVRVGSRLSLFGWYTLNFVNANTFGTSTFPNNQFDLAENYGPTPYDVRNRAFIGGTVALPRGFRLNPFLVVSSGIPFNITLGQDFNGDSIFNDRPTFATPGLPGQDIVITKWGTFNLTPLPGQTVIPPYYGTGPGRFSLNLRLSKTFGFGPETKGGSGMTGGPGGPGGGRGPRGGFGGAMGGPMALGSATNRRYNVTFSINARNVFNNINFAPLVGNLSSPLFGQPNAIAGGPYGSSSAPRKIELQAMFNF